MIKSRVRLRRRVTLAVACLALTGLVGACGGDDDESAATTEAPSATTEAPAATTEAPAATTEAPASTEPSADAEAEIAEVYEAAKAEGSLTLYTTTPELQTQPLIDAFKAKYPGIDVEFLRLSTVELLQRFASEAEAGVNAADVLSTPDRVFIHNAIADGTLTSLVEAGVPGGFPLDGFPDQFVFYDGETATASISPVGITYTTTDVSDDRVPTTFEDLLDPQWSGTIGSPDPNQSGSSTYDFWDFALKTYGEEFLTSFAAQDVDFSQLPVPLAQAQGAGEYELTLPTWGVLTQTMAEAGAPVQISVPDVTTGAMTYLGMASAAPHPNAARLFIQFHFSEEGARVFAEPLETQRIPWPGDREVPSGFVVPDTDNANTPERQAEIRELLGVG